MRVPATSTNPSSDFNTVGPTLGYHGEFALTLNDDSNDGIAYMIIHSEGADAPPCDEAYLVVSALHHVCATFGLGRLDFMLEVTNNIP